MPAIVPKPPLLFKSLAAVVVLGCLGACATSRSAGGDQMEGLASYYSDSLAGHTTANGEVYDPQRATCAHRTLPFGTWLRVTRVDTGVHATCRVNDRGPFKRGRVVDVSRRVAQALGLTVVGVAQVRLQVVPRPSWAGNS